MKWFERGEVSHDGIMCEAREKRGAVYARIECDFGYGLYEASMGESGEIFEMVAWGWHDFLGDFDTMGDFWKAAGEDGAAENFGEHGEIESCKFFAVDIV